MVDLEKTLSLRDKIAIHVPFFVKLGKKLQKRLLLMRLLIFVRKMGFFMVKSHMRIMGLSLVAILLTFQGFGMNMAKQRPLSPAKLIEKTEEMVQVPEVRITIAGNLSEIDKQEYRLTCKNGVFLGLLAFVTLGVASYTVVHGYELMTD